MNGFVVAAVIAVLIMLVVLSEIAAATLPLVIIMTLVPPDQRHGLAELIAAADSSRRLRLWPALRVSVAARRRDLQR
jgi:hypothetical protein